MPENIDLCLANMGADTVAIDGAAGNVVRDLVDVANGKQTKAESSGHWEVAVPVRGVTYPWKTGKASRQEVRQWSQLDINALVVPLGRYSRVGPVETPNEDPEDVQRWKDGEIWGVDFSSEMMLDELEKYFDHVELVYAKGRRWQCAARKRTNGLKGVAQGRADCPMYAVIRTCADALWLMENVQEEA